MMWRSFFLAIGVFTCICGLECLVIDRAFLHARHEPASGFTRSMNGGRRKEIVPPDWAPWSLMSAGAVTLLYSFTIPKRANQ